METDKKFVKCVAEYVEYWDDQELSSCAKLEGLAFSILVALDGLSGSFDGDLKNLTGEIALHEEFAKKTWTMRN